MSTRALRTKIALAALAFYALFVFRTSFVVDGRRYFVLFEDAMISMRYARHFAGGHGFVWNVGEPPIEGFTNLLWTLWMSAAHLLGLSESKISLFVMLTGVGLLFATGLVVGKIARRLTSAPWVPVLCLLATLFCYPLVFWTLRGMEVGAVTLAVTTLLWLVLENEERFSVPRTLVMSGVAAIAVLIRTDAAVPVGLVGAYGFFTCSSAWSGRFVFAGLYGFGPAAALLGQRQFRKAHFHEELPNTYYLKLHHIPFGARIKRGVFVCLQVLTMHLAPPLAVVAAAFPRLGAGSLKDKRTRRIVLLAVVFGAQLAYATYVGGDAWEWMLYANRYMCVGMPALVLLVALFVEDLAALETAGARARASRRFGLGLLASGLVLGALMAYARLRPEPGIAATIVFGKTPAAFAGLWTGLGALFFVPSFRDAVVAGLAGLGRMVRTRPTAIGAAVLVFAFVWLPCHLVPFGRWAGQNAAQYADEAKYTRLGLLIRGTTADSTRIAVAAAGATPYFCDRPTEDLLGKNDRHIARLEPKGVFSPGHDKWDYGYSLDERKSDLIVELVDVSETDDAFVKTLGFEDLPNELKLRRGARGVQREVLGTPVDDTEQLEAALRSAGVTLPEGSRGVDFGVLGVLALAALALCGLVARDDESLDVLREVPEADPDDAAEREELLRPREGAGLAARQIPALDGLRGLAVLAVLTFHFAWTFPEEGPVAHRLHDFLWSGWIGVDLFFVLSGFLITRGLVSPNDKAVGVRMKSFWMRRVLRIFPLYYAVVIVGTVVALAAGYYVPGVSYWLYMQNYALAFNPDALRWTAHFWSLAIEEQFYFVWPIVALVVTRKKLVPLTTALIAFVVLFRIAVAFKLGGLFWDEETTIKMVYRATPTRADGLLLGALVAVLQREHGHPLAKAWRKLRKPLLLATGVALLGLYALIGGLNDYDRRMMALGYVTLALFFACAVSLAADGQISERARSWLTARPLVACGKVSYGMYIFHWMLVSAAVPFLERFQVGMGDGARIGLGLLWIVVGTGFIYVCAWVSFRFFESPFLTIKSKFHD